MGWQAGIVGGRDADQPVMKPGEDNIGCLDGNALKDGASNVDDGRNKSQEGSGK